MQTHALQTCFNLGNGGHTAVTSAGPAEWIGSGEALIAMAAVGSLKIFFVKNFHELVLEMLPITLNGD